MTPLKTRKRTVGKGGGAYEVNRRSVLSFHQWRCSGLTKFCAGRELQPPVTKAYNQQMIKTEKEAFNNAEKLMCEAVKRLSSLTSTKDEDSLVEING